MSNFLNAGNKEWLVYANNVTSTANSNIVLTAKDGSGVVTLVDGALQLPYGISNERPQTPAVGMIRVNAEGGLYSLEWYDGTIWTAIRSSPYITSISPVSVPEGGQVTYTITGGNFLPTSTAFFTGDKDDIVYDPSDGTTFVNPEELTIKNSFTMSNTFADNSGFFVSVNNGGDIATFDDTIPFNARPVWLTGAGSSLGITYVDGSASFTAADSSYSAIVAIDDNTPISYAYTVGGEPAGAPLIVLTSSGDLSGTTPTIASGTATTYSFTAIATDSATVPAISIPRSFNFTVESIYLSVTYSGEYATGTYSDGGFNYRWVSWRPGTNTTSNTTYSSVFTINKLGYQGFNHIDYLLVAGGGAGGGGWQGGGGGAGGVYTSMTPTPSTYVTQQSVYDPLATGSSTFVVGGGGLQSFYDNGGSNRAPAGGGNTTAFGFTAVGGGSGAGEQNLGTPSLAYSSSTGGSGGGGSHGGITTGSAGTTGQGAAGGNGRSDGGTADYSGGGGGGAGAIGENAVPSTRGGNGGNGVSISITGAAITYGGGGAGVRRGGAAATGGTGGGGNSTYVAAGVGSGQDGTVGLGGGGGAVGGPSGGLNGQTSGNGGAGIVIIRFRIP